MNNIPGPIVLAYRRQIQCTWNRDAWDAWRLGQWDDAYSGRLTPFEEFNEQVDSRLKYATGESTSLPDLIERVNREVHVLMDDVQYSDPSDVFMSKNLLMCAGTVIALYPNDGGSICKQFYSPIFEGIKTATTIERWWHPSGDSANNLRQRFGLTL